jgi:hypothetical protein
MKRMKYLAGAAALAPTALAGVFPATASAASARGTGSVKTVSLNHSGVTASNGCTGTVGFTASHQSRNVRMHGWYTTQQRRKCIGTVVVSLYFTKGTASHRFCKEASLLITSRDGLDTTYYQQVCGTAYHWTGVGFGFHNYYYDPYLSALSTYREGYADIQFGE